MPNHADGSGHKLTTTQRRVLIGLTLVFALSLVGLSYFNLPQLVGLPARLVPLFLASTLQPPAATQSAVAATANAASTPSSPWYVSTTPSLAEEVATTSTTSTVQTYYSYLPLVGFTAGVDTVAKTEPPPVPPTPDWPDGLSSQTASKLGLHVVRNNDPYIMEYVRRVRPRVMKAVDDVGWLSDVKQVSPNTITIGRFNDQNEDVLLVVDPVQAANDYIAAHLERYRLNPGVDYWEGWNEFVPVNNERLAWYAQFEATRACGMQALGLRAAVGGFSTGVPEYDEMPVFLPALEAANACGGIFTLHEYNSPDLRCNTRIDEANIIPGAPEIPGVLFGDLTLRYRFWYEGFLKPRGLGSLPLVISELGVANILTEAKCNDPGGDGWKGYADWWVRNGYGTDGPDAYVKALAWYDQEMRKDAYVLGATIFTAGAGTGDTGWHSMEIHDVLVPLARYEVTQK